METTGYGTSPSTPKAPGTLDSALSKASTGAHSAVNTMAEAADGAFRKTKPAIDKVASMAHQAVDKAAASAAPAADWIGEKGEQLDATQKRLVNDTCAYISANPLTSIGLAVLAGVVLSRLTRSSS
jgi:ElaB/YqjD/DUF883 family membrane-anchored ribosome-binding protein